MHVLHGVWGHDSKNKNKFYIWAESSTLFTAKKNHDAKNAQTHTFAVSKNKLNYT